MRLSRIARREAPIRVLTTGLVVGLGLATAGVASAGSLSLTDFRQISDNTVSDGYPAISGDNIVWERCAGAGKFYCEDSLEIDFWDGLTITPLTANATNDELPKISGMNVAWQYCDGSVGEYGECLGDLEIRFWDGSASLEQITNNDVKDDEPEISGNHVVWTQCDGDLGEYSECLGDWEVFFWDGNTTVQVTDNDVQDIEPVVSGDTVVWGQWDGTGSGPTFGVGDWEIVRWDGRYTTPPPFPVSPLITRVTDDDSTQLYPAIDGNMIAWVGCPDVESGWCFDDYDQWEIFVWTASEGARQITDDDHQDYQPRVSNGTVVWMRSDGNDMEIAGWNGNGSWSQLTFNDGPDLEPDISGSKVVWMACDGESSGFARDCEPLTGQPSTGDMEIYQATLVVDVPEPGATALAAAALFALGGLRCRRRESPRRALEADALSERWDR